MFFFLRNLDCVPLTQGQNYDARVIRRKNGSWNICIKQASHYPLNKYCKKKTVRPTCLQRLNRKIDSQKNFEVAFLSLETVGTKQSMPSMRRKRRVHEQGTLALTAGRIKIHKHDCTTTDTSCTLAYGLLGKGLLWRKLLQRLPKDKR